jgi:methylmalonyl-CoA mutase
MASEKQAGGNPAHGYEDWRAAAEATLKGAPFEKKLVSTTHEGIAVQPVYGPSGAPSDAAGMPGAAPYTRGGAPLAGWCLEQHYAYPEPEANARALATDLARGVQAVWVRLDDACRAGLDHDQQQALALAGRGGAMLASLAELKALLEPVSLDDTPVSLDAGACGLPAAALLLAGAGLRGVEPRQLAGSLGADPLGALAADGQLPGSLEAAFEQLADLAAWCSSEAPGLRAIHVSTEPHHAAGANAVQELGIALATGVAYLRAMEAQGLGIDRAAGQLRFVFALRTDIFMELAKLRAARSLWSRVVTACGGSAAAGRMLIHARTSPSDRTVRDPWVNLLRSTTEAFTAAVAGADSVYVGPFDEAIGLPDDFSRRIAFNTQLLLREESHLDEVADPAGGSWYVEALTQQLIEGAWVELQAIEAAGGMAAALQSGWLAERIAGVAAGRARAVAKRKDPITGVSEFPMVAEEPVVREAPEIDDLADLAGCALSAWRADHPMVKLEPVATAAVGQGLATRAAIAAAAEGATFGAIAQALWRDSAPVRCEALPRLRQSAPYEALRDAADAYLAEHGHRPRIFLANLGPIPKHRARALWTGNFLGAGGFEVLGNDGFATAKAAAEACAAAVREQGAIAAVICGPDPFYPDMVPELAPALLEAGVKRVLLAGRPGERQAADEAAGVSGFVFLGCDVLGVLAGLQRDLGVHP